MTLIGAVSAARRRPPANSQLSFRELPNNRVYQRSGTSSTIPLSGTYNGTPSAVQARVINATTSAEVVAWTNVAALPSGGTWSGSLAVPQGGWYRIQTRFADIPATVYNSTNVWGVGDIWMFAGQSQQARMTTLVASPPASDARTVFFNGTTWDAPGIQAGTSGNGGRRFLNLMAQYTSVPQALIQVSVEGTSIVDWEATDAAYTNARDKLLAAGFIAGILWHQGGTGIGVVTKADYKARLADLEQRFKTAATVTRFGLFPLMHRTASDNSDIQVQETRQAHYEYLAEYPATINLGWAPALPMADEVHQTAAGSEIMSYAFAHALLYKMGVVAQNNIGPSITGVSRSGTVLTLTIQHTSGTALKTNTNLQATGFQVLRRGASFLDGSALDIASITLGTNTITINLSVDPGQAVDVYYQFGKFDNSSPVFDNTAALGRTDGLALQPLMLPVQSAAEGTIYSNPALKLDNDTGHIRYAAVSSMWNFPDADWTIGVWASINNPAGTNSQYLFSSGGYGALQTVNLFVYEAQATGTLPGCVEVSVRGAGAAINIQGPQNPAFLDTAWRLWTVERIKATETLNIYYTTVGGTRTLYHSASVAGLGAIVPTVIPGLGSRMPPAAGSLRYLDGNIWSAFKMDGTLTAAETARLGAGEDLISALGKTPTVYHKFNTLTTPIANLSGAAMAANIVGGVTLTEGPQFSTNTQAVQFNETGMIYTMPKTTSHNFPAADWTLGFMMALDDNAGTVAQYIYSTGGFQANNCLNVYIGESGNTASANMMSVSFDDGKISVDVEFLTPSLAAMVDGKFYLWTIERDTATGSIKVYYTPVNGARVLFHTHVLTSVLSTLQPPTAVMTIGGRNALATPTNRYFGGRMYLMFQTDGKLTQEQTESIARGRDLMTDLALVPKWYHKFNSTAGTLNDLSGNNNTATLSGGTASLIEGPSFRV